jgi:pilus assembly protein Flp/PilA
LFIIRYRGRKRHTGLIGLFSWNWSGAIFKQIQDNPLLNVLPPVPTKENKMLSLLVKFQVRFAELRDARGDRGAAAVEYGLMVALIAAVIVVAVKTLGAHVLKGFTDVNAQLP